MKLIDTTGDRYGKVRWQIASYHAAHRRVHRGRGKAKDHTCVDCGGVAAQWSYDHTDPDERTEVDPKGYALPYSLKPEHYAPRCKPCHVKFDKK